MNVKKIILITTFFLGNMLIIISLYFKKFSLGYLWYYLNANSLVGFQGFIESHSSYFNLIKLDVNSLLIFILEINSLCLMGSLLLIFPSIFPKKLIDP